MASLHQISIFKNWADHSGIDSEEYLLIQNSNDLAIILNILFAQGSSVGEILSDYQ